MSLGNIRIVLVRTFHPGNIGSAARSMKTMGLDDLWLVEPRDYPSLEAQKMAAGAADVLANATVVSNLSQAVQNCSIVIATTARVRGYDLPELTPATAAEKLLHGANSGPVCLIFGPERMGLHNADMQHARYRVSIPANPQYSSLNLAAAVQTLSYEIYQRSLDSDSQVPTSADEYPSQDEFEMLHAHLHDTLAEIGFLRSHQGETMQRLRNLMARAEITVQDYNILRGILNAVQRSSAQTPSADKKKPGRG